MVSNDNRHNGSATQAIKIPASLARYLEPSARALGHGHIPTAGREDTELMGLAAGLQPAARSHKITAAMQLNYLPHSATATKPLPGT